MSFNMSVHNMTTNESMFDEDLELSSYMDFADFSIGRLIQASIMGVIMLGSVIGNCFTLIAVYKVRALHELTSVFVVNLAVADSLAGLTCMPFTLVSCITRKWIFGELGCKIIGFLNGTFCATSMMTLGVVAVERFYAIVRPFSYHEVITGNVAAVMIAYTWLYSILVASMPLFGWSFYKYWEMESLCTVAWNYDRIFTTFATVTCFTLPMCILVYTYYHILKVALKQQKAVAATQGHLQGNAGAKGGSSEARAAFVLFTVIGTFLACWAPHMVGMMCLAYLESCPLSDTFFAISTWLGMLNSACNPVIYGIMNKQFRTAYFTILKCSNLRGNW